MKTHFTALFLFIAISVGGWLPLGAQANQPLSGSLLASDACPALHSIKKETNPGKLFLQPGQSYVVKAQNKTPPTHYLIEISDQQRWVATRCGQLNAANPSGENSAASPPNARTPSRAGTDAGNNADYLLAVSWQPAFCQTHQDKAECKSQTAERYDAVNLALHGLWPQPQNNAYCNVSSTHKAIDRRSAWHLLPALPLSSGLRHELDKVMPGTASNLQRHEWYKHGSCYGEPEVYYRDSLQLMEQLNKSAVRDLFANHIGRTLSAAQIRQAFDQGFGTGAGDKVNVRCDGKMISELWINLRGNIAKTTVNDLLKQAPSAGQPACAGGVIDPAGF